MRLCTKGPAIIVSFILIIRLARSWLRKLGSQSKPKLLTTYETIAKITTSFLNNLDNLINKPPDKNLRLTLKMKYSLMKAIMDDEEGMVAHCRVMPEMSGCEPHLEANSITPVNFAEMTAREVARHGIEWEDHMVNINRVSDDDSVEWQLLDDETKKKNMDIDWRFNQGDLVKIRIINDKKSAHPMHHPIHFHGQRFVVLARDGIINDNLEWKDTALIPTGQTMDIICLLYTSPSPRDRTRSRMPSSA